MMQYCDVIRALVDFSPEAVLQSLFGLLQLLLVLEAIQVGQQPHHLGEAVHLQMTSPDGPHAISILFKSWMP